MKKPNILGAGHDFGPFLFMLYRYNVTLSYIQLTSLLPVTYRLSLPSGRFAKVFSSEILYGFLVSPYKHYIFFTVTSAYTRSITMLSDLHKTHTL